jgi:DNA-binding IclR family transcriptional regulator
MTVLELMADAKRGFSLSEISRNLSLPKSSTYVALTTLEERGYIKKDLQTGRYSFSLKLWDLSRRVLEHLYLHLRGTAKPHLDALMRKTGLFVHLAVLEGSEAVIIEMAEPLELRVGPDWIGRRLDLHCSRVGKAQLAFLGEGRLPQLITVSRFARHNDNTIVTVPRLERELNHVRELGYALDDEEGVIGVRCVGVPLLDGQREVVAAISVAGPTDQIPPDRVPILAQMLKQTATEISCQLHAVPAKNSIDRKERLIHKSVNGSRELLNDRGPQI